MSSSTKAQVDSSSLKHWVIRLAERIRIKLGASRGQFATLCLLLIIGGTVIARPAGMLLWHRLRIITGMPRMAVATPDPAAVAQADPIPDRLDPGRPVILDDFLVRDPFRGPMPQPSNNAAVMVAVEASKSSEAVVIELDLKSERVLKAASLIRLSGTAKGLGTALLDGSVRRLGDPIKSGPLVFTLREVRSSEVVLDFTPSDGGDVIGIILNRSGVRITSSQ